MIVLSIEISELRDDTKVYFANVTNDVPYRHFDSLDVTNMNEFHKTTLPL